MTFGESRMLGHAEDDKMPPPAIEPSPDGQDPPSDAELGRRLECLRQGLRWDQEEL